MEFSFTIVADGRAYTVSGRDPEGIKGLGLLLTNLAVADPTKTFTMSTVDGPPFTAAFGDVTEVTLKRGA